MSIEAFLWNYRDGEPIGFDFATIREIFSTDDVEWSQDFGRLTIGFHDPNDYVDIYLGQDAAATNHVDGILISRPIMHLDYLQRVFRVMALGDVMLFYSDETTPVFLRGADPSHYPADLLAQLGTPRFAATPRDLLHRVSMQG